MALKCQLVINTRAGGAMDYTRVASTQHEQIALLIQLRVYAILRDQGRSLQTVGCRHAALQFHDGRPRPAKTLHDAMNAEPRSAKSSSVISHIPLRFIAPTTKGFQLSMQQFLSVLPFRSKR